MHACCDRPDSGPRIGWRHPLTSHAAIIGGLALVAGGGLAAGGWWWLAAAGVAPIILAILPCAVTCSLGLCMLSLGSRSKSKVTRAGISVAESRDALICGDAAAPSPAVPSIVHWQNQNVI